MRVYIFLSDTDEQLAAFTESSSGYRLPPELGPWRKANGGYSIYIDDERDARMVEPIKAQGYYLATDKPSEPA